VSLETSGTTVVAKIDGRTITGTLGRNLPEGKAGVAVLAGSRIDVRDFKTRPCPTPLPPASAAKAPAASASCFRAVAKGAR
jgi:hypothetical protein